MNRIRHVISTLSGAKGRNLEISRFARDDASRRIPRPGGLGMTASVLWFLLVLPGIGLAAGSRMEKSPWPHPREQGTYQARIAATGQVLWTVEWEATVQEAPGGAQVQIVEQGKGQPPRYKEPILWEKRMRVHLPGGLFLPQSVSGSRWTQGGRLLGRMDVRLDPEKRSIIYRDSDGAEPGQDAQFTWSADALPDEMLFHWARTLPFEELAAGNRAKGCLLLVSPSKRFRIQATVRGREEVVTPAGTFSCYRVELVPQLPGPLKALAPRISLWCRAEAPHHWVRYEGPIGGPGSPRAILELVRFRQGSESGEDSL